MANRRKAVYLTAAEASELLAISRRTLDRWAEAGRIPAIRTSTGERLFRLDEVLKLRPARDEYGTATDDARAAPFHDA